MPFTSLRFGFATNSSSSHSIIFSRDVAAMKKVKNKNDSGYGDSHFTITKPETKLVLLIDAHDMGEWSDEEHNSHQKAVHKKILKRLNIEKYAKMEWRAEAQKGQATYLLKTPDNINIDLWFDFICSDSIAFAGWNDNNDMEQSLVALFENRTGVKIGDWDWNWKQDGEDALVGFSKWSGEKIRWSRKPRYTKSKTPELVDVKITDWCGYGCSFCYQGSTKKGQHAPLERIQDIAKELGKMKVFEVALGGGEPVHHPQFPEIVEAFANQGIVVNFTTYGTDWAKNPDIIKALKDHREHIGAVGVSVHSERDLIKIERIQSLLKEHDVWRLKVCAQTVVGATPLATMKNLLDRCISIKTPLLLLGYKTTGRGGDFEARMPKEEDITDMLKTAQDATKKHWQSDFQLSVDTAFLDLYQNSLEAQKVPQWLRSSPEGKFSMYVDAVENTIAASSYVEPQDHTPLTDLSKTQEIYATF